MILQKFVYNDRDYEIPIIKTNSFGEKVYPHNSHDPELFEVCNTVTGCNVYSGLRNYGIFESEADSTIEIFNDHEIRNGRQAIYDKRRIKK